MKLLIAEDDLTSRLMLEALAKRWGFDVTSSENGEVAWHILQQPNAPHLLLLDWEMPKLSGLELCQRLNKKEKDNPFYIILLTSRTNIEDTVVGLESGANDYIAKPFDNLELNARLQVGRRVLCLQEQIIDAKSALSHSNSELTQAFAQQKLTASVFANSREGIAITDSCSIILDVNDSFSRITGYTKEEVVGQDITILKSGKHDEAFYLSIRNNLMANGYWQGEIWSKRKNGELYAEAQTITAITDEFGLTENYVHLFSDITLQKDYQQKLEHIAHFDALTDLPNRMLLADRLSHAMVQAPRRNQQLAVIFIDLDGFKTINDTHGHDAGDALLITISKRMKESLREGDTISRIGGDEFVAVIVDLEDEHSCVPSLNRLLSAASKPIHVGELVLQVSASIGVTFFPQPEDTGTDLLLRQADQAMYQAKVSGKNCYSLFDLENDKKVKGQHESQERIRLALQNGEFVLFYQPKVNMSNGDIIGFEGLIRWKHPSRGLLPPSEILSVVENHPFSIDIGEWVISTALAQLERWSDAGLTTDVSVNISAFQLQQDNFTDRLENILADFSAVDPSHLQLEVIETSALEDMTHISSVMNVCNKMGVKFSLDDFGTGYSSLTYLKELPASELKIDKSFVQGMLEDPDDLAILDGVIGLAMAFRRSVIAEGVETVKHGRMLLQLGCELAQGYAIEHPMPADQVLAWIKVWQPDPSWLSANPISQRDLPLLLAIVEHRAWVDGMNDYIHGKQDTPPVLDGHKCKFSRWLYGDGQQVHGAEALYGKIEAIHSQVHDLGRVIMAHYTNNNQQELHKEMDNLYQLREVLIYHLEELLLFSKRRH